MVGCIKTPASSPPPPSPMTPVDPSRATLTHLQIRRVQNGFVIFCYNHALNMARMEGEHSVAAFVARDAEELATIVTNLADASDLKWLPSADLPLVDLKVRG